jgi:hypothetical protein
MATTVDVAVNVTIEGASILNVSPRSIDFGSGYVAGNGPAVLNSLASTCLNWTNTSTNCHPNQVVIKNIGNARWAFLSVQSTKNATEFLGNSTAYDAFFNYTSIPYVAYCNTTFTSANWQTWIPMNKSTFAICSNNGTGISGIGFEPNMSDGVSMNIRLTIPRLGTYIGARGDIITVTGSGSQYGYEYTG